MTTEQPNTSEQATSFFLQGRLFIRTKVIPHSLYVGRKGNILYKTRLLPIACQFSRPIKNELLKIHKKRNLLNKFRVTLLHKALGLYLAMLSTEVVSTFFEVRSVNNLWGLFPQRHLVSDTVFSVISFSVEFVAALTVFTLTEHYLGEFREWRQRQ